MTFTGVCVTVDIVDEVYNATVQNRLKSANLNFDFSLRLGVCASMDADTEHCSLFSSFILLERLSPEALRSKASGMT